MDVKPNALDNAFSSNTFRETVQQPVMLTSNQNRQGQLDKAN